MLPFATAAEIQNTDVNQSVTVNASNNIIKYGELKTKGLEKGSEGKYVVELQKWLKNHGYYSGDLDGSFGPYTKEAVKMFQNDSKIVVDGWVANQTINSMEKKTGKSVFTKSSVSTNNLTNYTHKTSKKSSEVSATNTTNDKTKEDKKTTVSKKVSTTKKTKVATSTASKTTTAKKSVTSSSSLSAILASGAKYGYSHSASTAAGMMSIGSGDCWAMSAYLYSKLSAAGIKSRIVQYSTAYSSKHRSVQLYQNGAWVDVPYSSYGYSTMFKATSSKPGMRVLASS